MNKRPIYEIVKKSIEKNNCNLLFIHSDILKGFEIKYKNRSQFLEDSYQLLTDLKKELSIWMPAFNYDFPTTKYFSLKGSDSQVGTFSNFFLKHKAQWRTQVPIFSISGTGAEPEYCRGSEINPFDETSVFHRMVEQNATIMFYGASFDSVTFSHHCEYICQIPYRYYKTFKGIVVDLEDNTREVDLKYLVRPQGFLSEYNMNRVQNDLEKNGILQRFEAGEIRIMLVNAKELRDFVVGKMKENKFYLLSDESAAVAKEKLERLGRPFLITDFEKPTPA